MIIIPKNRLVVPEAREAFEKYKMEIANEFGVDDPRNLASRHTGMIVRHLVADGQRQLMKKWKQKNPKI
ncbi:MAG TPA: alpha/beta-type small acid-soluble spore protein [Clostridia bacterium]|nr:alpha/beta-type small acid-soluble spore protein [Clostridia bacterium]